MPKRSKTPHPEIWLYENGFFYYRGKDGEKSLKTKDYTEAVKKLSMEQAKRGGSVSTSKLKVKDVVSDYVEHREKQRDGKLPGKKPIRASTFEEMQRLLNLHLIPYFGRKTIARIDEDMWDSYCEQSMVNDLSNHRKVFGGFLRWCKRKKYLKYMPELEIPHVKRRPRRLLTESEILGLFRETSGDAHLFFSIALFMGMRRGEIVSLRWENINLDEGFLIVLESVSKTNQERLVVINSYCLELLKKRYAAPDRTQWVFPNAKNRRKHMSEGGPRKAFASAKLRAGIEGSLTWNDLRATCEKYAHLSTAFTDAQREKYYGSSTEVQKRTYAHRFLVEELRGLEDAVQVPGLKDLLIQKLGENAGNEGEP